MKLMDIMAEVLQLGYSISFERDLNMVTVIVYREELSKRASLPFDHLYESKVIGCIKFLKAGLE